MNAPRASVYRALLDAEAVAKWMVPDGMSSQVHAFDAREGGFFRISLTYDKASGAGKSTANTDTFHGRFVKLVPNEQVVERVEFETADPGLQGEMTITFNLLLDATGGTDVVAVHDGLPPGLPAASNEVGWRMSLAKLAALVEEAKTLLGGLAMGESPRWHANRLWLSDWGAQEILAIDLQGNKEVVARTPFGLPFCIDWLPDGRLLVVSGRQALLLRQERDGSFVVHANLGRFSDQAWNEIVVDGRGNAYVNGGPGIIVLVAPDGRARQVAGGLAFPNGMAVTPDNSTLIVAESHGKRLTAFEIEKDGSLSNRRVWADLGNGAPDGICLDADNGIWYGDVPNRRCVRVREGGEVLQSVELDRGCFACMLGGAERKTLFLVATEWRGMEKIPEVARARTGQVLTVEAPAPGVGWP